MCGFSFRGFELNSLSQDLTLRVLIGDVNFSPFPWRRTLPYPHSVIGMKLGIYTYIGGRRKWLRAMYDVWVIPPEDMILAECHMYVFTTVKYIGHVCI